MSRASLLTLIFLFGCALATHQRAPAPPPPEPPELTPVVSAPPAPPPPHGLSPGRALDTALWHLQYAQGIANQRSQGGAP